MELKLSLLFSSSLLIGSCSTIKTNQEIKTFSTEQGRITTPKKLEELVNVFTKTFSPLTERNGYQLKIDAKWLGDRYNGYADVSFHVTNKKEYLITLEGVKSLMPHEDFVYGTLCHELGHFIGGYPFVMGEPENQISVEGQADYFQSFCLRHLWKDTPLLNASYRRHPLLSSKSKHSCEQVWAKSEDRDICYRTIVASINGIHTILKMDLADIGASQNVELPSPDKNEPLRVYETYHIGYSTMQCRLDTLISSALCNKPFDFSYIPGGFKEMNGKVESKFAREIHAESAYCLHQDQPLGARPLCWYKPLNLNEKICESYGFGVTYNQNAKDCRWTNSFCQEMNRLNGESSFFWWSEGPCIPTN